LPISSSIICLGQVLNRFAGANDESDIARGFPRPPSDCSRFGLRSGVGWVRRSARIRRARSEWPSSLPAARGSWCESANQSSCHSARLRFSC